MTDATTAETLRAEIAALESEIDGIYREAVRHDEELTALQDRAASLDYGPSEYKYLSTRSPYVQAYYRRSAQFWRNLAVAAEIRGRPLEHRPRPRALPAELRPAFDMDGRIPVLDAYFAPRHPPEDEVCFTAEQVAALRHGFGSTAAEAAPSRAYSQVISQLLEAVDPLAEAIGAHVQTSMTVAVCGSVAPIYESLCLNAGAAPSALGFASIRSESHLIATASFADAVRSGRRFDRVVAGWLVAQAGMGLFDAALKVRAHSDAKPVSTFDECALDPDGDLALMDQLKALIAPDGLLIAGVPVGPDLVAYNSARIYGPLRLPLLLQGFEEVARVGAGAGDDPADKPRLVALILRPSMGTAHAG
jgi:hypothetical protein